MFSKRVVTTVIIACLGLGGVLLASAATFSFTPVYAATQTYTDHCPDHNGHPNKIEASSGTTTVNGVAAVWSGDPGSVTFTNTNSVSATVNWCAKGGNNFGGTDKKAIGDSGTVIAPGQTATFNFGTEVSYFLVYGVTLSTPNPNPTPTPTPTPSPTPVGGQGGVVAGAATTVQGAQVEAPAGAVGTGFGAETTNLGAVLGFIGSLGLAGFGLRRLSQIKE